MKKTAILIFLAIFLVIGFYFLQPKEEKIYGRALVLLFTQSDNNTVVNIEDWEKLDLTFEVNSNCADIINDKLQRCIEKNIKKASIRTQSFNKNLILISEGNYSDALLKSAESLEDNSVSALVLLNPNFNQLHGSIELEKLLVVNDVDINRESDQNIRETVSNIRNNDNWVWSTLLVNNGKGLLYHPVLPHMVSYLINGLVNPNYEIEFDAESLWQHPQVNNDEFWTQDDFVKVAPVTIDIKRILNAFYAHDANLIKQWPLKTYHAFDLIAYRNSLPKEKQGRYASFSNRKGHKFYLDLEKFSAYGPEFVIGIDDEKNLYRLTSFYKTKRFYSWKEGGPENDMLYSQSLGAFIHFQSPLPRDEELPYLQYSSILFESISFTDNDPYQKITKLSDNAFNVVTLNCLPCHSIEDVGGAAHHLDFRTVQAQPGFAQPLLSYPRDVLNNFFFNQTETAKLIGVNPNYVEIEVGRELIDWLQPRDN